MAPMRDFSGLVSSHCVFASAPANAAIDSLERCMALLPALQEIEAHGAGFGALGPYAMPDGLPGVFRHQAFELGLGVLMVEMGLAGLRVDAGELRPSVGAAHIDNADGLD